MVDMDIQNLKEKLLTIAKKQLTNEKNIFEFWNLKNIDSPKNKYALFFSVIFWKSDYFLTIEKYDIENCDIFVYFSSEKNIKKNINFKKYRGWTLNFDPMYSSAIAINSRRNIYNNDYAITLVNDQIFTHGEEIFNNNFKFFYNKWNMNNDRNYYGWHTNIEQKNKVKWSKYFFPNSKLTNWFFLEGAESSLALQHWKPNLNWERLKVPNGHSALLYVIPEYQKKVELNIDSDLAEIIDRIKNFKPNIELKSKNYFANNKNNIICDSDIKSSWIDQEIISINISKIDEKYINLKRKWWKQYPKTAMFWT